NVSPQEIAEMEQALIEEGVPVEQVQKVCDVHVQVFEKSLGRRKKSRALPGHPVHTYLQENKTARTIVRKLRRLIKKVPRGQRIDEFERELGRLKEIEVHYRRKENQLFPFLESVNFTGPSKVMWGKHDEIRAKIRDFESSYTSKDWSAFRSAARSLLGAIRRMIFMEERILFPTSLKKLSEEHWARIRQGEGEIGYAWIKPGNLWDPSVVAARSAARNLGREVPAGDTGETWGAGTGPDKAGPDKAGTDKADLGIPLDVGRLSGEQINLLLKNLPLDVTYVDENDRVLYYSQGTERIFPRSPGVIGRAVQNCHPPKSVHIVEKILKSFRKHEKSEAEFWITMEGRFIHIRYFPLYDGNGEYRGVIEMSQDVTPICALKGERRLLDW
ncbi:MAG TPA: DUF438 domain-containing protein, partial [Spirochaetia bacterium]|nr:DUF438 domain-containing protein [Spirochaetia bacterium]